MIHIKDLENAIDKLGIATAKVCVHSSIKSFGDELEGGIKGIVDAFLNKDCTVMVPTFSYDYIQNPIEEYMPERNGIDYDTAFDTLCDKNMIFHPNSKNITIDHMGVLSKCILDEPISKRGNHPINSFAAIGKYAESLTSTQTPQNVYAPFQQLLNDNGYILLMGVGLDRATIIHYAEQLAGRRLFIRWANNQDGKVIPIPGGGCSSGFNNFQPILKGRQKEVLVGKSLWQCYKAKDIVDLCRKAIIETPQITHCNDSECKQCNDAILGGPIIKRNFF